MASVKCHQCGYEWNYTGEKPVSSCPDCNAKTNTGIGPASDGGPDKTEIGGSDKTTVVCENCGYEWEYGGNLPRTICPGCERKTHTGLVPAKDDVPAGPIEVGNGITREVDEQAGVLLYSDNEGGLCAIPTHQTRLY